MGTCVAKLQSKASAFSNYISVEHARIGASLARIGFGVNILYYYVMHIHQRYYLWGPDGVYPLSRFLADTHGTHAFTLYAFSTSLTYFNLIFFAGILIDLLYVLGYRTRVTGILNYIFTWSAFERNGYTLDGGDNLLILCLFYMMFMNVSAYFSLDASRRRRTGRSQRAGNRMLASLHNFGVLACIFQLLVMYMTSGLYKAQGNMWIHGTALYYVMRVHEFSLPSLSPLIYEHPVLVTLGTYATVFFQLAFPFLIWNRKTKWLMAVGSVLFHTMIAVVMGLVMFGLAMITTDLLLFGDHSYQRGGLWLQRLVKATGMRWKSVVNLTMQKISDMRVIKQQRIIVLYDGWCPMCTSIVRKWTKWDVLRLVEFCSFREFACAEEQIGISTAALEQRMHALRIKDRHLTNGIHTVLQVCLRLPVLWFFVPFLSLGRLVGLGQVAYDFIASRRTLIPAGKCDEETCLLHSPNGTPLQLDR